MAPQLFKVFSVIKFLILSYIRLPSNVTVFFRHLFINQAHVSKAQNKCSFIFIINKINKYFIQQLILIDEYYLIMWVSKSLTISNQ